MDQIDFFLILIQELSLCFKFVKAQLNNNLTQPQPNLKCSWVSHENDFAYHSTPETHW